MTTSTNQFQVAYYSHWSLEFCVLPEFQRYSDIFPLFLTIHQFNVNLPIYLCIIHPLIGFHNLISTFSVVTFNWDVGGRPQLRFNNFQSETPNSETHTCDEFNFRPEYRTVRINQSPNNYEQLSLYLLFIPSALVATCSFVFRVIHVCIYSLQCHRGSDDVVKVDCRQLGRVCRKKTSHNTIQKTQYLFPKKFLKIWSSSSNKSVSEFPFWSRKYPYLSYNRPQLLESLEGR